ncbi:uncharacterized protein SPAPADRAFT_60340 [Spathaspora passalidarum NRRL Y-27907]|uniref:Uncharacterized protein n=1 Tax=Spathaspora passalidarum (strain NRRL Y-27907 / 11-Y1) TaxID=619300 RepID=G3AKX2_SPAPN|nr:uncharacterized protein SPAPADRAFT_60340 [Spathaspora passalidarum NRRL Y-27907]EGW33015.1 hypothetical protein SPAPADRAFT_60340 [Spathaspora passalidarum NRRL Y-27907]
MFDPYTNKTIVLSDPEHPELGDYKIPTPINYQKRDPYAKYDDQGNRRNKNEPMHPEQDLLDMWSTDKYDHVSLGTALKYNGIFFGSLFALGFTLWYFEWTPAKPAMIRSYPYNGLAAALGAGSDEDAHLYQARPDVTAEAECGILPDDEEVVKQKESYLQNNAKFIKVEAA